MKIVYLGEFSPYKYANEKYIKYSLEKLGHQVIPVEEENFYQERNRILEEIYYEGIDLFLFHKGGIRKGFKPQDLIHFLTLVTCKKVFWWFDKIADDALEKLPQGKIVRKDIVDSLSAFVDYGFVTDGTFLRRNKYKNLYLLRQGVDDVDLKYKGKYKKEYDVPIAFLGAYYGDRKKLILGLKKEFGNKNFKVFNNIFDRDLKDFCASCKVQVAPRHPGDDFYWSSRIYQILGNGGFLIHPKLEGLKEEFEEGKHYVGYKTFPELVEKIKYYLRHDKEREKIRKAGHKHVIENFTYTHRIKEILKHVF